MDSSEFRDELEMLISHTPRHGPSPLADLLAMVRMNKLERIKSSFRDFAASRRDKLPNLRHVTVEVADSSVIHFVETVCDQAGVEVTIANPSIPFSILRPRGNWPQFR